MQCTMLEHLGKIRNLFLIFFMPSQPVPSNQDDCLKNVGALLKRSFITHMHTHTQKRSIQVLADSLLLNSVQQIHVPKQLFTNFDL